VIGVALEWAAAGAGLRPVAARLGVPHTTVRDWWRRFQARAPLLGAGLCALIVELGGLVADLDAAAERACLGVSCTPSPSGSVGGWVRPRRRAGRWRRWSAAGVGWPPPHPALGGGGRAGLDATPTQTPPA